MSVIGSSFNPKRYHKSQLKFHFFLIPLSIFMLLPIIYILNDAFKPYTELFAYPPNLLVSHPTLENFRLLFSLTEEAGIPMSRYFFNSILVSFSVVILTVLLSSMTAFAFSKLNFKYNKLFFKINTYALVFVPIAVAIPRYLILVFFGVYNTYWAHIIPIIAMPVGLFLVKQFIDQIPDELLEAAIIDGANHWQIYYKIIIPLTKSAIVTVAFLAFQVSWMSIESSNIFIEYESLRTLPFFLSTLAQSSGNIVASRGIYSAGWFLLFVPNLLIFLFLQSKVMESMAQSGIK